MNVFFLKNRKKINDTTAISIGKKKKKKKDRQYHPCEDCGYELVVMGGVKKPVTRRHCNNLISHESLYLRRPRERLYHIISVVQ